MKLLPGLALILSTAAAAMPSRPDLGTAAGTCRPGETGPGFLVTAAGLKDRKGRLRLEVYPDSEADFLADDNVLLMAGKTFRRVDVATPAAGPAVLCIRVPAAGAYTMSLLHDRDSNHRFGVASDGLGFPGDPPLRLGPPPASAARVVAGHGLTPLTIRLNYHHGLLAFSPIGDSAK